MSDIQLNEKHVIKIALELGLKVQQVVAVATLLAEEATVPFIARYRKEATGEMDEVQIAAVRDRLEQLAELDKRREAILKSLEERELLTDALKAQIQAAEVLAVLEDIYLPFRPKRRTRATIAREKGLEPLAKSIMEQSEELDVDAEAANYVSEEKKVESAEDALAGARDIIAETISENQHARAAMRDLFAKKGVMSSKVASGKDADEKAAKFKDYFEWNEAVASAPSHRLLAMFRGENEEVLKLEVAPPEAEASALLDGIFIKNQSASGRQVKLAVDDGYKRLLAPSMETEIRQELKKRADEEAIRVFAQNLRELLLSAPLGQKNVLALDPGFRTGCKLTVLDRQGKLVHHDVIYPTHGDRQLAEAADKVKGFVKFFEIEAVAIGNGTASRETEQFVRSLELPASIAVVMVNESGASIYSASEVAREEFPDQDVTVRGSVSIGRRLQDPLAELVKIDPKSIGVGQYQHDVDQPMLKKGLDGVVESCVNSVGVEVNTASRQLLTYVSGLGPMLAGNIIEYRNENGAFKSRAELKKVKRLGPKAFEQCAGFLRIRDGKNPLDASAVHPESYSIVEKMAKDLGCSIQDLMRDSALRQRIKLDAYITDKVGLPTLNDIMSELAKPGRDPRDKFEVFQFSDEAKEIGDLKPGMKLPGIVTNVTAFGAFVDIGVHQDGLVHISQLSDTFVKDPADVVKVHQRVMVTVLEVDVPRKRISLSMKSAPGEAPRRDANATGPRPQQRPGQGGQRGPAPQPKKPQKFNSLFDQLKNLK
ncbi:RNA-binding transcriptional accessory protein [bacterium]|nr:RNA-binding transcriptional accessory protein [bacterium]